MARLGYPDRNLPETLTTWFLQVLGAASAVIFGVYGALSWQNSNDAKRQADMANLVSLVALCAQLKETDGQNSNLAMFCNGVQKAAEKSVTSIASALLGNVTPVAAASTTSSNSTTVPTSTPTSVPPTSASGSGGLDDRAKLAVGLGLGIGFPALIISGLTLWSWYLRRQRSSTDKAQ